MKTMHLFAGLGGGLLADRILNHDPIIAVEWNKYCCNVLRERAAAGWFPNLQVWQGDVRMFDPSEYAGRVDCINAGFPCQDISLAGNQAGVGAETRSGLYREVIRIARIIRPRYIFLENVAAIVTNGLGTVLADITALGYDSEWLCLRASDCGANHHRDRWWMLARQSDVFPYSRHSGICKRGVNSDVGAESGLLSGILLNGQSGGREEETEILADANRTQLKRMCGTIRISSEHADISIESWCEVEPNVGRVANGVSSRVDRIKGLGNAQVPIQAAIAFHLLKSSFFHCNN